MIFSGQADLEARNHPQSVESAIVVFAAASTTEAVEALAARFFARTGNVVVPSFAASSALARQIDHGAPADIFLSAHPRWMDYLEKRRRIVTDSRCDSIGNRLVLVTRKDSPLARLSNGVLPDLDAVLHLAMGDPDHVPAGLYGRQALTSMGAWSGLESRVVSAADVRAALAFVARGEADAGIVYATDGRLNESLEIIYVFPPESHDRIVYPLARVRGRSHAASGEFVAYLFSREGLRLWRRFGFTIDEAVTCSP